MTSHQFAKQLLAGPDLELLTPRVVEYSDEDDMAAPVVTEEDGIITSTEQPCRVLVVSYAVDGSTVGRGNAKI